VAHGCRRDRLGQGQEEEGQEVNQNMANNKAEVDHALADVIYNWIQNDQPLHKKFLFFTMILNKKVKKGIFDEKLAVKGFMNVVDAAILDYNKQPEAEPTGVKLNPSTKQAVAKMLLDDFNTEHKGKMPKKNKVAIAKGVRKGGKSPYDLTPEQLKDKGINPEDYKEAGEVCMAFLNVTRGRKADNVDICTKILDAQLPGEKFSKTLKRIQGNKASATGPHNMRLYLDATQTGDDSAWIGEVTEDGDVRFTIIQEIPERITEKATEYEVSEIEVESSVATDLEDQNVKQVISELSDMDNAKWLALDPERRAYLLASGNPFGPEQYMSNDLRRYKRLSAALSEEGLLDYKDELGF
jgi:hypothetical protein